MNPQYISDSKGETTGVFIPIQDWCEIVKKYKGIDKEETAIPGWHKELLEKRMNEYQKNPEDILIFDQALDKIENQL